MTAHEELIGKLEALRHGTDKDGRSFEAAFVRIDDVVALIRDHFAEHYECESSMKEDREAFAEAGHQRCEIPVNADQPNKQMAIKNSEAGIIPHKVFLAGNAVISRTWGPDEGKPYGNYYPGFWDEEAGGVAFVTSKEQALRFAEMVSTPEPVSVSLEKAGIALDAIYAEGGKRDPFADAAAVLEAAGVPYVQD